MCLFSTTIIALLSLAAPFACALPATNPAAAQVTPPALSAAASAIPIREWTVMLFINTKNNLSESGVRELNLAEHAAGGGVGFVAQLGTEQLDERILREYIKAVRAGASSSEANAIHKRYQDSGEYKVRRYTLTHDRDLNKIASRPYGMKTGRDMGDWKSLSSFIRWAKKTSPARRYALILSSHGEAFQGVSKDAQFPAILPQGLGQALRDSGGLDLLILEACLMASAESLYELRDSVKLAAASEDTVIDRS
ncbi:MAG TPA: clostripain-related cysteine peptidase, partial [Elusimicrobiales bacterium]|nr:clostripain-related cysteine peptidase [Elusimicrobiales bacterium]